MTCQPSTFPPFSQEEHFSHTMTNAVSEMWQQRHEGKFTGVKECELGWVSLTPKRSDKVIIVVNGRVETYWKYQELFYDLVKQGYHVYSFDHRGQGVSERLVADHELGYVEHFDDYVEDLHLFMQNIVKPKGYKQHFILGHSMGGAITSLALARYPTLFDRAVLSAPMHGIYVKPHLKPFAEALIGITELFCRQPHYAIGQKPYYAKPFDGNLLTHSQTRYQWFRDLYDVRPKLRIGGASNHWVWESIKAARQAIQQANTITISVLLLQGSEDKIVDNACQQQFQQRLNQGSGHCNFQIIEGSRHEILFESDPLRNQAIAALLAHFA